MDADRPRLLREARERRLDLVLDGEHQVRQLVHDEHDVREDALGVLGVERQLALHADLRREGLPRPFERLLAFDLLVEVGDVPRVVGVQQLVAPVHLADGPLEHRGGFMVIRHHRQTEMGQRGIHRELDHFGVDHQELELLGRVGVDEARDERVDAHRLPRPRGAGDEQVRHLGQVVDDLAALEVAADGHRQGAARLLKPLRLDQLAQQYHARPRVRDLDTDRRLARNRRHDAQRLRPHRQRQVVGERRDSPDLDAGAGRDFVLRHHRADRPPRDRSFDPERL